MPKRIVVALTGIGSQEKEQVWEKIMSSSINKRTRGYSSGDSFFLCFIEI